MLTRNQALLCTLLVCLGASAVLAQSTSADLQKALREKAAFDETDFAKLQLHQPIVRSIPTSDKAEIAVSGLVNIQSAADEFLRSYRDSMTQKSNTAILEIGAFGREPSPNDLETLTLEARDIEDLKECVVGECQVKLSAAMIERFRREINWNAADYGARVTDLFRQMMFEYVKDYRSRGEAALIQYNDKRDQVSLAEEQRALNAAPSYVNEFINSSKAGLEVLEDTLVWSKIKFGLKPVIAINHITIYKRNSEVGPQVLIASKQIYANHYFNASLALTAFVRVPDAPNGAYLVYENRSRADGLEGPFGKIKRGVVEKKAVEGLRAILEHSKTTLEASTLTASSENLASYQSSGWGSRFFGGVRPLLWLLVISALIALLALGRRRTETPKSKVFKPESAKS